MGEDIINPMTGLPKRTLIGADYIGDTAGIVDPTINMNKFNADIDPSDGLSDKAFADISAGKGVSTAAESVSGFDMGKMFSSDNIGGTMQGIGAIAQAAAGIYDAHNKKKYQDKVFAMEEKRVARETERQDKQQAAYDKVFG